MYIIVYPLGFRVLRLSAPTYLLPMSHMVIMTTIINKDKEWFKNQVRDGIEGFIDCEREYLSELLMKYVYEQIFLSGCAINTSDDAVSEVTITISIPIPNPEKCVEYLEEIRPVSILTDH